MAEKRGLGRGLSALLGESEEAQGGPAQLGLRDIPIDLIHRNEHQPRFRFDEAELEDLAASLRRTGVLQPILVRPLKDMDGHFQIVAGERRWRAAQKAGLHVLPAIVRDLGDIEVMEISIVENVQRSDLNAIEEAMAYNQLIEGLGRTHGEVAEAVGKSRAHVANTVRLINLPGEVREHILAGHLSAGHGRALLGAHEFTRISALAEQVLAQGLSVRATEALVRESETPSMAKPAKVKADSGSSADIAALEHDLSEGLGLDVAVLDRDGRGEVRISYKTLEQLDEICRRLTRS
ncbi:MAG: chromosome partitioning protein ParB [Phenylobacterium zucineum]|nr:MAG: chromosome partitioning protein ParB [Phenylobacterium zucineum]